MIATHFVRGPETNPANSELPWAITSYLANEIQQEIPDGRSERMIRSFRICSIIDAQYLILLLLDDQALNASRASSLSNCSVTSLRFAIGLSISS